MAYGRADGISHSFSASEDLNQESSAIKTKSDDGWGAEQWINFMGLYAYVPAWTSLRALVKNFSSSQNSRHFHAVLLSISAFVASIILLNNFMSSCCLISKWRMSMQTQSHCC
jgi:hypothetical protein